MNNDNKLNREYKKVKVWKECYNTSALLSTSQWDLTSAVEFI